MTNAQLYIAVCIPMLVFIGSLIISLVQLSGVRAEIASIRDDVATLREDIREIRADIKLLTGKVYEIMGDKS